MGAGPRRPPMRSALRLCAALAALAAFPVLAGPLGCGSQGQVVFGITSELAPGADLTELHYVLTADGATLADERLGGGALSFPLEIDTGLLDDETPIAISLEATHSGQPVLSLAGSTSIVGGSKLLYEIALETECVGASCDPGQTCEGGSCVSAAKDPADLPGYFEKWAGGGGGGDRCEPGGAPEVIVGSGQADYHTIDAGEVLQVEAGPQGGYHVWVAARLKNLKQSGSVTDVSGTFPGLGYAPPPMSVVFTFDPDEGDYCKIYGLRFRLDDTDHPIASLLGQPLDLTVHITDKDGDEASDTVSVTLSENTI